jgi:2-polyprenyl-6-methoxyphenol hydroxylase-like FAD-dependent oxidoreductase
MKRPEGGNLATRDDCDVLIVGAGPVGLALAIELGHRGIRCVVVEQRERVGYNPRAKTTNVRTREHLRRWGLDGALRAASPIPPDYPSDIVFSTRLDGHVLARFENAFHTRRERNPLYSAEAQWVPQYVLEEALRAHAATLPTVTIRFNHKCLGADQDGASVTASIQNLTSGETRTVAGRYLVGADGARSTVRELIGARMEGEELASRNLNIVFRSSDIAARIPFGPAIQYWLVNSDMPGVFGPMDLRQNLWFLIVTKVGDDIASDADACMLVRRALGEGFAFDVVGLDPWSARSLIASCYRRGRAFLAGDACHLHPPFGGYGMNMGIGDAVDLGWKLAAVLQGWGGPALLDSYEQERRPVHRRVIDEAAHNYASLSNQLTRPDIEAPGERGAAVRAEVGRAILDTKVREFQTLGVVLGYRYADSPVIVPDGSTPPPEHFRDYRPSACPGCLAPHAWLADGSSLYDHFGSGLTLLVLVDGGADAADRLTAAAVRLGVPLKAVAPADPTLRPLYGAAFALIRPDQHVCWRGDGLPADLDGLLCTVCGAPPQPTAAVHPDPQRQTA